MRIGVIVGLLALVTGCDADEPAVAMASDRIPDTERCAPVGEWSDEDAAVEAEVLAVIAARREEGIDCGDAGWFGRAPAPGSVGPLRCVARLHVLDMALHDDPIDHVDSEGFGLADRVRLVEYDFADVTEVVGAGDIEPARMIDEVWLAQPGSCASLMADEYIDVGIGYLGDVSETYGGLWTVVLAVPAGA